MQRRSSPLLIEVRAVGRLLLIERRRHREAEITQKFVVFRAKVSRFAGRRAQRARRCLSKVLNSGMAFVKRSATFKDVGTGVGKSNRFRTWLRTE